MKRLPLFKSIEQISEFLKTNKSVGFKVEIISKKEKYLCINEVFWNIGFRKLSLSEKHIVFKLLKFFTGYSISHLKRLGSKWRNGTLKYNSTRHRNKFFRKYFPSDIALLIKTDTAHHCLSGRATKRILNREFEIFKNADYANISNISVGHLYNIRNKNNQYATSKAMFFKRTKAIQTNIGIRQKPMPNGSPGYLRVDTVHQGDYAGIKGLYHINMVDEVTQYELVGTVEKITEFYLRPVMEELLKLFPFKIFEFHSDNGSEYVNKYTVKLLNKLHIELTKSRSRHSNDNALVESKNGSIIRKLFGRNYIDKKFAKELNKFNKQYLNIYINYHRPCAFAVNRKNKNGKIKKHYNAWMTPYEKLKSLKNAKQYLKHNFSFKKLDKLAMEMSDNDFAIKMNKEKSRIFKKIENYNLKLFNKKTIK
jgi:hypothetical protein